MSDFSLSQEQRSILAALANGVIPADDFDQGAASVHAAERLAERIAAGLNASIYLEGLAAAEARSFESFNRRVDQLTDEQVFQLVGRLRDERPAFFKLLRADVAAMYLSDAEVWRRIGFPGPSIDTGGHPDFDQPQGEAFHRRAMTRE